MSELPKSEIVELFSKNVKEDKKILVKYEISGGPPGERIREKIIIGEGGNVKLELSDDIRPNLDKRKLIDIDPAEQKLLLEELAMSLDKAKSLLDEQEMVFLPDSVVSSLTIQVGNKSLTLHFLTEEFDRKLQNKPIPPELSAVIEKINLKFSGMGNKNG